MQTASKYSIKVILNSENCELFAHVAVFAPQMDLQGRGDNIYPQSYMSLPRIMHLAWYHLILSAIHWHFQITLWLCICILTLNVLVTAIDALGDF